MHAFGIRGGGSGDLFARIKVTVPKNLTEREYQVLALLARGLTNKEIAYRLGISERTIQFHINSIFNKTGAQSRTEAVGLALKHGWIDLPG